MLCELYKYVRRPRWTLAHNHQKQNWVILGEALRLVEGELIIVSFITTRSLAQIRKLSVVDHWGRER